MAMSATANTAANIAAGVQAEIQAGNINYPYLLQLLCAAINLAAQASGSDTPVYTGPTFATVLDNAAVIVRANP